MTFGNGEPLTPRSTGSFDFGLAPSSQGATGSGGDNRRRRRRPGPDRTVLITVGIVAALALVVVAGAGAVVWSLVQQSEAAVAADSAEFCADLAATPGVLAQPGFGWPTEAADLPATVEAMTAYKERWDRLATIGPPTIRADLAAVASAAGTVVATVESTQSINRAGNLATIEAVTTQTAIAAWAAKYCD